jgi:hypothetical protein
MRRRWIFGWVLALLACGATPKAPAQPDAVEPAASPQLPAAAHTCRFPRPPTVVKQEGAALLQVWEFPETEVFGTSLLPDAPGFLEFRRVVEAAGADLRRPVADPPVVETDAQREMWRREDHNLETAFGGNAGVVRPVACLDALLFAEQDARFSELESPTEFLAIILRKRVGDVSMLRVYHGGSDQMFPPKAVYGIEEARRDVAEGWQMSAMLHNHTIQEHAGEVALGVPVPSTNDVQLLRALAEELGLQAGWVTNGLFTIEVPVSALDQYLGPADAP